MKIPVRAIPACLPSVLLGGLLLSCLGSCGGEAPPAATQDKDLPSVVTRLPYEFTEWHDDFPYPLHTPPRKAGRWYDRNSQEALDKIIANLSGLCTKPAWLMAKEFFDRHWDRAAELLIEKLDETQLEHMSYDQAENIVGVMGRATTPIFARVLVRAAAHQSPGIRRAAFRALRNAGDEAAVLEVGQVFGRMDKAEQIDWLKAAARHLSDAKLAELFQPLITQARFAHLQSHAFEQIMKLEPKRAAAVLEPIWSDLAKDLQLHAAGMLHAIGDGRGTVRLRHALRPPVDIVDRKAVAVQGAMRGDATPLINELLALTNEDHEALNLLIVAAIHDIPGQPVTDTLLTLTDPGKPYEVRQLALRALVERGVTGIADELLTTVRSGARGGNFNRAVADLVGAQYAPAAMVFLERAAKAPRKEEIFFVRMIAKIGRRESFLALKKIFMRAEERYEWREHHSNVTFLGVMLANLDVAVDDMIGLLHELPRQDYRRRAALIHVLANVAGAKREEAMSQPIYDEIRRYVFDPNEMPQIRILALDYIRKDLRLSDASKLKSRLEKEKKGMRQYLSDYLFEFF